MGDYQRSTRESPFEAFTGEVKTALLAYIEKYNLGPVLDDTVSAVQTDSEKIKKGLFAGPGPKHLTTTLLLTRTWLIIVTQEDQKPPTVLSIRLAEIVVSDYEKSPFYARLPDTGVEITGSFGNTPERGMLFVGLGKDAAGENFRARLIEAVQNAK